MSRPKGNSIDYVTRVLDAPSGVNAAQWDGLLETCGQSNAFMRHAYLAAMHTSGSAVASAGWTPRWVTLWEPGRHGQLVAACPLYLKDHSYGEYVFDWAWANAYSQHGLDYYPKALIAVPFTPVPGPRLLAINPHARAALLESVLAWCKQEKVSSLHVLFGLEDDMAACQAAGLSMRHTVQFHWKNDNYTDFDAFLARLHQEKRKKIRQERRKVAQAGITFTSLNGAAISTAEWDFFYRCYERTYWEHGNAPYLTRDFFRSMQAGMSDSWVLFIARRDGLPIACSLICTRDGVAWGRYWGALERVDCLHFEACYYQPIEWCIAHGISRFEGGAQGEHKMARALMPVATHSAHWLAHPAFADAVDRFLAREARGIEDYMDELRDRSPFRHA